MPGTKEKILSGQFKVRDADMHRLARADFPNRKQIVHEILHPEDRSAPQSSYSHYSGINYSALEVAVRRIQQDFDFLTRYLPKLPDDSYAKTETLKILKQHKAYMAQFEEMLNDKEIAQRQALVSHQRAQSRKCRAESIRALAPDKKWNFDFLARLCCGGTIKGACV